MSIIPYNLSRNLCFDQLNSVVIRVTGRRISNCAGIRRQTKAVFPYYDGQSGARVRCFFIEIVTISCLILPNGFEALVLVKLRYEMIEFTTILLYMNCDIRHQVNGILVHYLVIHLHFIDLNAVSLQNIMWSKNQRC